MVLITSYKPKNGLKLKQPVSQFTSQGPLTHTFRAASSIIRPWRMSNSWNCSNFPMGISGRWLTINDLPLWKIMEWKSVGVMTFPIYGKIKKNVPKHQPALVCHFLHLNVLWHLCIKWLDVPYFSSLLDMVSELHLSDRCCSADGAFAVDDQILGPWCIGGITEAVGFWDLIAPKSQHRCWSNPKVSTSNHGGFLDVVFHGEIPPKRWAFHGFKPCFPHFFHIKCPVLWRNPSSLCTSVASLVSSEGIWGEFATKGEQWGRRVRIYTEIQRYCIILYCIIYDIYVWICVYIYDYFHIYVYVYIYMVTHTHTRARKPPPEALNIFTCQHRLLRRIVCFTPSTLKTKKTMNLGTYPHPTPKYINFFDLFWGRWFGCFGFLASPPNPK